MTFGKLIRDRRKSLGLSVEQLAEKLDKNRATVYRYENDEIENMPISVLNSLAKALFCSPSHLMGWEEDNNIKMLTISSHIFKDLTQEEQIELINYAQYIKSKRNQSK